MSQDCSRSDTMLDFVVMEVRNHKPLMLIARLNQEKMKMRENYVFLISEKEEEKKVKITF